MEPGIIVILVIFAVDLYYIRFVALQWMRTDKSRPPMKFYYCILVSIITSTFIVLYRLYIDYPFADEFLMFGWLALVLALGWMFYRVASQCPTTAEVFPFMAKRKTHATVDPAVAAQSSPVLHAEPDTKV
jgi:hypothetical protein